MYMTVLCRVYWWLYHPNDSKVGCDILPGGPGGSTLIMGKRNLLGTIFLCPVLPFRHLTSWIELTEVVSWLTLSFCKETRFFCNMSAGLQAGRQAGWGGGEEGGRLRNQH